MPDHPFILRDAFPSELDTISALITASYLEYEPFYAPEVWQRYIANVGRVDDLPSEAQLIVAERDGAIAGSVLFYADGSASGQGEWPAGWAGILRLAVPPAHRGRGIGRALVEECLRRAREAGVATIALHSTEWMSTAREMYARMGFVRVEAFDFMPRPGVIGMGYKLDL